MKQPRIIPNGTRDVVIFAINSFTKEFTQVDVVNYAKQFTDWKDGHTNHLNTISMLRKRGYIQYAGKFRGNMRIYKRVMIIPDSMLNGIYR